MLQVGIVGGGIRGQMYAQSLHGEPQVAVRAVSDVNETSAQDIAVRFGLTSYRDHREMLAGERLDAVIVATPDFAHRDIAVDAAAAGAHLLLEKPLATTAADVATIAAAVENAGVHAMVGFENRWNPQVHRLRQLSEAGDLGDILTQNIVLSNTFFVPTTMISWAARSSPAWFLMSHTVDAAVWVAGKTVTSVVARGSRGELAARGIDTWDVIHALLTFDDGTTANLTSTWVLPETSPSVVDFQYKVVGSQGAVDVDLQDQGTHLAATRYSWPGTLGGEIDGRLQGPPTWMARSFAAKLNAGQTPGPGLATGAMVTDVVLAILDSLRTGESTPIVPTLPAR